MLRECMEQTEPDNPKEICCQEYWERRGSANSKSENLLRNERQRESEKEKEGKLLSLGKFVRARRGSDDYCYSPCSEAAKTFIRRTQIVFTKPKRGEKDRKGF